MYFKKTLLIYLSCAGSLMLCGLFFSCCECGPLIGSAFLCCCVWALGHLCFRSCGAWAELWCMGSLVVTESVQFKVNLWTNAGVEENWATDWGKTVELSNNLEAEANEI